MTASPRCHGCTLAVDGTPYRLGERLVCESCADAAIELAYGDHPELRQQARRRFEADVLAAETHEQRQGALHRYSAGMALLGALPYDHTGASTS